ncbi:MAG: hypothetical protein K2G80_09110, partial [Bacteroidales bacterium]|nr:hypothetical protein [Bacteroidales bacterium]
MAYLISDGKPKNRTPYLFPLRNGLLKGRRISDNNERTAVFILKQFSDGRSPLYSKRRLVIALFQGLS